MRYRVDYRCKDITYGYEGEEIETTTRHTRYYTSYYEYEQFLQDLDMTGEGEIIFTQEISDFKSNLYYGLAYIIYLLGGGYIKATRSLFYKLMVKTLRPLANDSLCIKFDNCVFGREMKKW